MSARFIADVVSESLRKCDGEWRGVTLTYEQKRACQDAAHALVGSIVHTVNIDTEQANHFACWFIDHVLEKGMSPMDYIIFATYLNTAEIRDESTYQHVWMP